MNTIKSIIRFITSKDFTALVFLLAGIFFGITGSPFLSGIAFGIFGTENFRTLKSVVQKIWKSIKGDSDENT